MHTSGALCFLSHVLQAHQLSRLSELQVIMHVQPASQGFLRQGSRHHLRARAWVAWGCPAARARHLCASQQLYPPATLHRISLRLPPETHLPQHLPQQPLWQLSLSRASQLVRMTLQAQMPLTPSTPAQRGLKRRSTRHLRLQLLWQLLLAQPQQVGLYQRVGVPERQHKRAFVQVWHVPAGHDMHSIAQPPVSCLYGCAPVSQAQSMVHHVRMRLIPASSCIRSFPLALSCCGLAIVQCPSARQTLTLEAAR